MDTLSFLVMNPVIYTQPNKVITKFEVLISYWDEKLTLSV